MSERAVTKLIERLERASGPDRALDAAIAKLCAPTNDPRAEAFLNGRDYPDLYTGSLDAALTLVPEEWSRDIWLKRFGGHHWWCELHIPSSERSGRHVHAAIAVAIAALRALNDRRT